MNPPVSVCLPTFNGAEFIESSVESVLAQSFADFELIVVDDDSSDATVEVISQCFDDERIKIFRNEQRLGLVGNWNESLRLASGEFCCVWHQDDLMEPGNLLMKIEALRSAPGVGMVFSNCYQIDRSGSLLPENPRWPGNFPSADTYFPGHEFLRIQMAGYNAVCAPTVVFRRECYQRWGGFRPELPFTADWEMWMRISTAYDVAYLSRQLVSYRWHEANETRFFAGTKLSLDQELAAKMIVLRDFHASILDAASIEALVKHRYATQALILAEKQRSEGHWRLAWWLIICAVWICPRMVISRSLLRTAAILLFGPRFTQRVRRRFSP